MKQAIAEEIGVNMRKKSARERARRRWMPSRLEDAIEDALEASPYSTLCLEFRREIVTALVSFTDHQDREVRKYAQVGLDVARTGDFEGAGYCAMHVFALLWSPLRQGRAKVAASQAERGRRSGRVRREQAELRRQLEMDRAAAALREMENSGKKVTLKALSVRSGILLRRLRVIGLAALKRHARKQNGK